MIYIFLYIFYIKLKVQWVEQPVAKVTINLKKGIRDAHTPQPGELVFNTMTEVVKQYKDRDTSNAVSPI